MPSAPTRAPLTVTALVPSYRRPDSLLRCLDGLLAGERRPDQIVVVLRDADTESQQKLQAWREGPGADAPLKLVLVSEPGQIAAVNAGLAQATGDIVGFPDDDCIPRPDWLRRIVSHYTGPEVGGVGGRDVVHNAESALVPTVRTVGKLTWYGRIIGKHHCEVLGGPRPVDHLKGVNMTFRRELLKPLDARLRGPHFNDTDTSLSVKRQGKVLIFDPEAKEDHYPAQRLDNPAGRDLLDPRLIRLDSHDWTYLAMKHLPALCKPAALAYIFLIGTRLRPGLLRGIAQALCGPREALSRMGPALAGSVWGLRTYLAAR